MTHEADTTNFAMSLLDDSAEAEFCASVDKVKPCREQFTAALRKSEREIRMSFGRWSIQDKLEWSCITCTYLNQPLFLSCEVCGQPRPTHNASKATIQVESSPAHEADQCAQIQREILLEEEEHMLKEVRIKEIIDLQQGLFNKIREENEEHGDVNELEESFAWLDLEDTLPMKELPASTGRESGGGTNKKDGAFGKKPSPMDVSSSTVTTAAMSSLCGSSRLEMDLSANSQHSRLSWSRNSAIPDQALASLKEESSFVGRGTLNIGVTSNYQARVSGQPGFVDFKQLRAALEGVSFRSLSAGDGQASLQGASIHSRASSYGLLGGSNHSIELEDEPETPDFSRRRGALAISLSSLIDGFNASYQEQSTGKTESRPSLVGAMRVAGAPSSKSIVINEAEDKRGLADLPGLCSIGAMSISGATTKAKDTEKDKASGEDFPRALPTPIVVERPPPKTLCTGMIVAPQEKHDSGNFGDLRGSLHRNDGGRRILTPPMVQAQLKTSLQSPSDHVFSRNLYADRRHEASNRKKDKSRSASPNNETDKSNGAKGVRIPLLNRMLRKKKHPKVSETN